MKIVWIMTAALALALTAGACSDDGPNVTVLDNGAACSTSDETEVCASDLCLEEFADGKDVNEGMCTEVCEWNDDLSDTCAEGEVCLTYRPTNEFYCFEDCTTNADCRAEDGWTCLFLGGATGACIPDLTSDNAREGEAQESRPVLYDSATTALAL